MILTRLTGEIWTRNGHWCRQLLGGEGETDEDWWNGHEVMVRLSQVGVNRAYIFSIRGSW